MGKKKTGAMPTSAPKQKKKMVIDMTKVELAKAYQAPGFRTGKHMTAKDRPRKKDWKREYEKEKGSGEIFWLAAAKAAAAMIEPVLFYMDSRVRDACDRITIPGRNKFFNKISRKILEKNTGNR